MSMFKSKDDINFALGPVVDTVKEALSQSNSAGFIDADTAGKLALESDSLSNQGISTVENAFDRIKQHLSAIPQDSTASTESSLNVACEAGAIGGLIASGLSAHLRRNPMAAVDKITAGTTVIQNYMGITSQPRVAFEAYDEKEIRNVVIASTVLNYSASRQNPFAEMFFKTIVLSPEQTGHHMFLEQTNVMKEVRREISGKYRPFFDRVNLVKAGIDHTILLNNETDVIPVIRAENEHLFVEAADVPRVRATVNGVTFDTGPLKMGADYGLIDISTNDALLRNGHLDHTDALDPAINIQNLYLKVGADVIKLSNLHYLTSSNFVPAPQGDSRAMILDFRSQQYPITKATTKLDGADLTGELASIKTNEWVVRLKLNVTGSTNLQDSGTSLNANPLQVASITDKDGNPVDLATTGKALVDAVATGKCLGYELKARRTNSNKRTRGLLLDVSSYSILYTVPLLGPISTNRPLSVGEEYSQNDLAHLISAVRYKTSNDAVTALFQINDLLRQYATDRKLGSDVDTEYLGIARKLIQPYHEHGSIDVKEIVRSLKNEDRPAQVQSVLINQIRDSVFRAWYESGMGPAAEAVFAGQAVTPIVKIGTDPIIARYLQVQGDLRTIGGKFEVQIEDSWDARMQGKIFITFGWPDLSGNGAYNPLEFGFMLWKPEVVIAAPIFRDGATNRELTVQPSYIHIVSTPIMLAFDVLHIKEAAVGKVNLQVTNTP